MKTYRIEKIEIDEREARRSFICCSRASGEATIVVELHRMLLLLVLRHFLDFRGTFGIRPKQK